MHIAVNGQTIHWLTFIDTTDPNVGQIDVYGRQMLYSYFINDVNSALELKGYKSDIQDFYGAQVSPQNCKDAVNMLSIDSTDDIIVFYYIGHGGRPAANSDYMHKHPYPQMCLAQHDESKFIPLEWVDSILSSKGARLSITIGMCCNNIDNSISVKDEPQFDTNYGKTYLSKNKITKIQDLFLNTKGHIIATSASPSQTSGCIQIMQSLIPNPACFRDRYSYAICSFFQTQLDNYPQELTWNGFLEKISWFVDKYSNHEQTPIHDIYVAADPKIKQASPKVPEKQEIEETGQKQIANNAIQQGDKNSRDWINELTSHLSTLIKISIPSTDRMALENNLAQTLFSDNAIVKFLGQEGKVIDKMDVRDWLGILSTNPNGTIIKVIVDGGKFDDNKKIKELKVREIYKK